MVFTPTNKAPGVYIDEITTAGPIAGAATSIAAFVGPARRGPINHPVRLANWNAFVAAFGLPDDLGPYLPTTQLQVTPAVAGFFENGGADCWFVRVGTARRSSLTLVDRSAAHNPTLVVEARTEGVAGDAITVAVQGVSIVTTQATRLATTLSNAVAANMNRVDVPAADAANLRVGDWVVVDDGTNTDRARITAITGGTLEFAAALTHAYAAGDDLRIADLDVGQRSIRVDSVTGFQPGSGITLTQGATTEGNVVASVDPAGGHLVLDRALTQTYDMSAGAANQVSVASQEFTLVIGGTETYAELSLDPRHDRYFASQIDSPTVTVRIADNPPNPSRPPDDLPDDVAAAPPTTLGGGADDDPGAVGGQDFKDGIDVLRTVPELNILCVPDRTDSDVQGHMIDHCEAAGDRFAILDPQPRADSAGITAQRNLLGSDNGFAGLYWPRIVVANPIAEGRITIAPSGHLAGLFARVDDARGVFKAPANEALDGVLDLERTVGDDEQGPLNEQGINVIRRFPGRGVRVWGARTIAPRDRTVWRYVNVRRFTSFVERSLIDGTQFVVFEPNTPALWEQVKRQVREFLTRQWTAGALVGATADDAFQVICDESLNTPASMALGQLIVEVRMYPAPPAEYVVFRIIQIPGGPPEVQE
jgi:Bacteriophage tail sheath protein